MQQCIEDNSEAAEFLLHELAANNDVQQLILIYLQKSQEVDKIDINEKNYRGETPLHVAAINNNGKSRFDVIDFLLNNGADPNVKDNFDKTPLWYLVYYSAELEILELFLQFGANFTCVDQYGTSLLGAAITKCYFSDQFNVVKFLVKDVGLDLKHRDMYGRTALHYLALQFDKIHSHYEIFEFLFETGADPNAKDVAGITPLYHLIEKGGNLKVIELFLRYNADVYSMCRDSRMIIFSFNDQNSDVKVLQKLIDDFGLDVNQKDDLERTPLHYITKNSGDESDSGKLMSIKVIKCLLKNGANFNAPDTCGATPLIEAVSFIRMCKKEWFLENLDYFNFLIDLTDFSVAHNNVHVFDFYQPHQPNYLWKWILEHLAKLKFLSIPVHPIILEFIEDHFDYMEYFIKCTEELEVMSSFKLKNSWLTYFNLLVDSRRKLKNYAANEELIQDFEKSECFKKFSIYGALMKKNVEKGLRRRKLFDKSSITLSVCLPIFNPNHLIIKGIFDCILSKKYLTKFCE